VKRGEGFSGDVNTSFVNKNITADVKVDTQSNVSLISLELARDTVLFLLWRLLLSVPVVIVTESLMCSLRSPQIFATVTVDEFAPGAKSVFTFTIPDHKSGKVFRELVFC
jgi:voltage-dependent anion channel protein 2